MKNSIVVLILGLLLISFPGPLKAWEFATDTINSDVTWSGIIHVYESIVILDDVTLTIEPGTRVEFHGHYHIQVLGTILARGTEDLSQSIQSADGY